MRNLRAENARLLGLLGAHGVVPHSPDPLTAPVNAAPLSTDEKVTLFRRLF